MIVLFYRYRNGNLEKVGNLPEAPELTGCGIAKDLSKERYCYKLDEQAVRVGYQWLYLHNYY